MSKKANPTIIGSFVVGATVLVIVGVIMFGKGEFFSKKQTFILYFNESIYGLDIGAPVDFRGVKVGSVSDIKMKVDREKLAFWIPVLIEFKPERISYIDGTATGKPVHIDKLIERGFRAQLQMQSVVTGKLFIALDMHPDKLARRTGYESEYPEIPTIPTTFQAIADTATKIIEVIQNIPVDELVEKATEILTSISRVIDSSEIEDSLQAFKLAMTEIQKLAESIDSKVDPLADGIGDVLADTNKLVRNIDDQVAPLSSSIGKATGEAQVALEQAKKSLATLEELIAENSAVNFGLADTLEQLSAAARSIRILADYLERNPEALLRGKKGSGGK